MFPSKYFLFNLNSFLPNMPALPMQDRGDLEDRCNEGSPRETPGY